MFEALKQLAALLESNEGGFALDRLARALDSINGFAPTIVSVAQKFEQVQRWMEEAPAQLREALKDAGTIPHPALTLEDIRTVTATFAELGSDAAVERIRLLHSELFEDETFRRGLVARWQASGRWAVLEQILKAHDEGLYYLTVPTALAQAEGIVAAMVQPHGGMKQKDLPRHISSLEKGTDEKDRGLYGPSVDAFVESYLLAKFHHGDPLPAFSRHAILHGADTGYGTLDKSLRSMVWVDYLLICREEREAVRADGTSAEETSKTAPTPPVRANPRTGD